MSIYLILSSTAKSPTESKGERHVYPARNVELMKRITELKRRSIPTLKTIGRDGPDTIP